MTGLWRPIPTFRLRLIYQYDDFLSNGSSFVYGASGTPAPALIAARAGVVLPIGRSWTSADDGLTRDRYLGHRVTADASLELGSFSLQSLTGYSSFDDLVYFENDLLPGDNAHWDQVNTYRQFFQEVRLTSPTNQTLQYMVGASYLHGSFFYSTRVLHNPTFSLPGSYFNAFNQTTESLSAFGQASLHFAGDRLIISGGLRYTSEEKRAEISRTTLIAGPLIGLNPPIPATDLRRRVGSLDGSVDATFRVNSFLRLYAAWSKGTKGGGFQNAPTNIATAEFAEEEARTAEVGAKFNFGRVGFLNLALFNTDVSGFQSIRFTGVQFVVDSLPLRSRGFEVEGRIRPIPNLTIGGAVTYAEVTNRNTLGPVRSAPRWSGIASIEYTVPFRSGFSLTAYAATEFRSSMYLQAPPTIVPLEPGFQKLNARVTLASSGDHWELSLIGRNLTNVLSFNYGFPLFYPNTYVLGPDQPRTVALQLSVRY